MSQNLNTVFDTLNYSRLDFTALRAHLLRIPTGDIADLYYSPDSPQVIYGLERFLKEMRKELIDRSVISHPKLYQAMSRAGFGGKYLDDALRQIRLMADSSIGKPQLNDPIAQWIRPKTAALLLTQEITNLGDLVDLINLRGYGWHKPIPKLGDKRAKVVLNWLKSQGFAFKDEVHTPLAIPKVAYYNEISPQNRVLAPLEAVTLPSPYDGSQGGNRALADSYIGATNDLEAIKAYLVMHKANSKTYRSYTKELERFLLWSVIVRGKALSSLLVDDCEAYKDFLQAPSPEFCGKVMPRFSKAWRPFAPSPLSPKSQKYAVLVIRTAFDWLVKVRYLAGNPWVAVKYPQVEQSEHLMQIEKALSADLWERLIEALDVDCAPPEATQMRIARAAILLMGDSGLRREEVAGAEIMNFTPSNLAKVYELQVLGKRKKWRTVPVSPRTVEAIKVHLEDRQRIWKCIEKTGAEGESSNTDKSVTGPLLCPLKLMPTKRTTNKHSEDASKVRKQYTANGIYALVDRSISILLKRKHYWTDEEKTALTALSAHDFRHTFATQGVASGVPMDVMQSILGHASMTTTSIYVQSKKQRTMEEAAKYFLGKAPN
jgi:site-specific recombinase XerD